MSVWVWKSEAQPEHLEFLLMTKPTGLQWAGAGQGSTLKRRCPEHPPSSRPLHDSRTNRHLGHCVCVCVCAKPLQSCLTLCDPMDCSPPDSSVHGILQARILEWVACPPPGDLPDPRMEPVLLCLLHWQVGSLPLMPPGKQGHCIVTIKVFIKKKSDPPPLTTPTGEHCFSVISPSTPF